MSYASPHHDAAYNPANMPEMEGGRRGADEGTPVGNVASGRSRPAHRSSQPSGSAHPSRPPCRRHRTPVPPRASLLGTLQVWAVSSTGWVSSTTIPSSTGPTTRPRRSTGAAWHCLRRRKCSRRTSHRRGRPSVRPAGRGVGGPRAHSRSSDFLPPLATPKKRGADRVSDDRPSHEDG